MCFRDLLEQAKSNTLWQPHKHSCKEEGNEQANDGMSQPRYCRHCF